MMRIATLGTRRAGVAGQSRLREGSLKAMSTKSDHIPEHFERVAESSLTKELVLNFARDIRRSSKSDVVVVGTGLSGLMCVYHLLELAEENGMDPQLQITLIERDYKPGGLGWTGSTFMNALVVRKPADALLDKLGVFYEPKEHYVVLPNGTELVSKLLANISSNRNVRILKGFEVEEVLVRNPNDAFSSVRGVACTITDDNVNSHFAPPFFFNSEVVVSACGHHPAVGGGLHSSLRKFASFGWNEGAWAQEHEGVHTSSTDVAEAEDYMVHHTREVSKGLIVAGSQIAWLDGCAKTAPTVGGSLHSGLKSAELALKCVLRTRESYALRGVGLETAGHFLHDDALEPTLV